MKCLANLYWHREPADRHSSHSQLSYSFGKTLQNVSSDIEAKTFCIESIFIRISFESPTLFEQLGSAVITNPENRAPIVKPQKAIFVNCITK